MILIDRVYLVCKSLSTKLLEWPVCWWTVVAGHLQTSGMLVDCGGEALTDEWYTGGLWRQRLGDDQKKHCARRR